MSGCSNATAVLHHAIPGPAAEAKEGLPSPAHRGKLFTNTFFPAAISLHRQYGDDAERHGFEVHDVENWREHYQRTCKLGTIGC